MEFISDIQIDIFISLVLEYVSIELTLFVIFCVFVSSLKSPTGLQFDEHDWEKHLKSLKPMVSGGSHSLDIYDADRS